MELLLFFTLFWSSWLAAPTPNVYTQTWEEKQKTWEKRIANILRLFSTISLQHPRRILLRLNALKNDDHVAR